MHRYFSALLCLALCCTLKAQQQSELRINSPVPITNGLYLSWQGGTGATHTLQYQDTLNDRIWRVPAGYSLPGTNQFWTDPYATNSTRFYRVLATEPAQRGRLISSVFRSTMSRAQLTFLFQIAGIPITPQNNVRLYKLVYETTGPAGARTRASGALMVPDVQGTAFPLVSYQHGTLVKTNEAPSNMDITGEAGLGIALASVGYAAVLPDYLGLGDSPGLHPYHHARSEATAGVDMLRAARAFCASTNVALSDKLFLCGYSQGGHATLALLRELETFHTNEFAVTACAAMAGAYDLSGVTTDNFLSARQHPNPYYLLYLLGAYQEVYRFAPSLGDLLREPYNTTLPPLLNGNATGSQINEAITNSVTAILKPEVLSELLANPRHPLRLAAMDNDLIHWRPRAPLRLYHCSGDADVPPANAQVALSRFHALGATHVQFIDPLPGASHGECAQPSMLQAKAWFDSLK